MKKWIGAVALVLALGVVAGAIWGRRIWLGAGGPVTPLGRIESVKSVDTFPEGGGFNSVSANPGHRLWVVSFTGEGSPETPASGERKPTVLLDDTGAAYESAMIQISVSQSGGDSSTSLVFSLPEGRTPRSVRFGDSAPLALP